MAKGSNSRQPLAPTDRNAFFSTTLAADCDLLKKATPAPGPTSSKRKAIEIEDEDVDEDKDEDEENIHITLSCNQIRSKIRKFLKSGEMNQTTFLREIGVNSNSYGRFMGYKQAYQGVDNGTYEGAFHFFRKREKKGLKIQAKKVKPDVQAKEMDVSAIQLEGEDDASVPVYDSCDEVRRKIKAYLQQPSVTQAGFLREIAKTYTDGRKIQSKSLNNFLTRKGPCAGNTSAPFYASYVFFEKKRLREGKGKSNHRINMEREHPGGFEVKTRRDRITCMQGDIPVEDAYGKITFADR